MRGAVASLAIALLLLTPLAGVTGSCARTTCAMSCCLAGAHTCPMRGATSCRACTPEANTHATAMAKVIVAMPATGSPLIAVGNAPQFARAAAVFDVAPPPVPPPQRG